MNIFTCKLILFGFLILFLNESNALQSDSIQNDNVIMDIILGNVDTAKNRNIKYHEESVKNLLLRDSNYIKAYVEHSIWNLQITKEGYSWQLYTNKVFFFIFIILVLFGIISSGIQFYNSIYTSKHFDEIKEQKSKVKNENSPSRQYENVTEIEIGLTQFKFRSSLMGIILLAMSFLFIFLYIIYIFPIKVE